jgi:hypothetical protein
MPLSLIAFDSDTENKASVVQDCVHYGYEEYE